ncbi:MAG: hypothetical protein E7253_00830 [Lachnospiraceae bacterium]|nr:hypothetical protein [Lachnospiraceae bacterium]
MPVLNCVRAGRKNENYLENLIWRFFTDERVVVRKAFGVCDASPQTVTDSFYTLKKAYNKLTLINVHCMELIIEYEYGMSAANMLADLLGSYLYSQGFQSMIAILDTGNEFVVVVALNAVSFINGKLFHDNNATYIQIFNLLKSKMPYGWDVRATDNTFFGPGMGREQYVHGYLV